MGWKALVARGAWLVLAVAMPAMARAESPLPDAFGSPPQARFVVSKDANFAHPERAMRRLLAGRRGVERFCVIGYRWADGGQQVWVHRIRTRTLILWDGSDDDRTRDDQLRFSRRPLQLGRDTVATPEDIAGSTYLETHAWWHALANDCALHGERYAVRPAPRRPL